MEEEVYLSLHITPPNEDPIINKIFNPLILHAFVIEALNVPKMDLLSKTDPYVLLRFEKDKIGVKTKFLDNTLTPQWNELLDLIITDQKEDLIVEIWDKNVTKDNMISSTTLSIEKYLNGKPHFEWIKIGKMNLNLVIQIKPLGEKFITKDEIDLYLLQSVPDLK